ncbi:MAG: hypothetical protein B7Y90_03660 [Alphaproteobacteria bacterium 32-64-14]|nr:MAG: hypothetical protein B7Y90_03660 [Alphaproteobacteria bacterium 32-64-14]
MFLSLRSAFAALLASTALCPAAFAQGPSPAPEVPAEVVKTATQFTGDYQPPRLSTGKPDLHGFWSNASVSRMERPQGYPLIVSEDQAAELEGRALFNVRLKTEKDFVDPNAPAPEKGKALPGVGNYDVAWTDPGSIVATIKGEKRSSYITFPADGKIPAMTEEGRKMRAAAARRQGTGYDNPEERGSSERCLIIGTNGPPFGNYLYNNNFQIVQTGDHLVIMSEMIHDVRIARIGGEHRSDDVQTWMGDSIAHWDGDTLVVETRHIDPRSGGVFVSPDGKIVERFTRIADDQILYEFEIDDPKVYASTWRGQMPLTRLADQLYEYACHEGNYGLVNILEGGRSNDRAGIVHTGGADRGE